MGVYGMLTEKHSNWQWEDIQPQKDYFNQSISIHPRILVPFYPSFLHPETNFHSVARPFHGGVVCGVVRVGWGGGGAGED